MAAFCPSFFSDSVFLSPDNPMKKPDFLDDFDQFCSAFEHQPLIHEEGSSLITSTNGQSSCLENNGGDFEGLIVTGKQRSESFTSMAEKAESGEQVSQVMVPLDKKRKSLHGCPSISAHSKDVKQGKWKKQKGSKEEMVKNVKNEKGGEQAGEEPPKDYVHVRARRGQATDSHSLAERARREKISQKMKALQALVPGCDKVTGKALMLDEIINYVQSLQNQVEFLSMKLASLDPMVYFFGMINHDSMAFGAEEMSGNMALQIAQLQSASKSNSSSPTPSLTSFSNPNTIITNPATTAATATATGTTSSTAFSWPCVDNSVGFIQGKPKPNGHQQDARSSYWGLNGLQQHSIMNQFGNSGANNYNKLYSFQ